MRVGRRAALVLLALLLALTMSACFSSDDENPDDPDTGDFSPEEDPNAEYPVRVGDAEVGSRPVKVISLTPEITEKIGDLGFADRLMGVSDFCDYPQEIVTQPRYGTADYPDVERIRELDPHVIFSHRPLDEGVMAELADLDLAVVVLGTARSVAELEEIYITIATVMEGKNTGRLIGESFVGQYIRDRLNALPSLGNGRPALYLCALDFNVATGDTLEGELLTRLGFVNIAAGQSDYFYADADSEAGVEAFRSVEMLFLVSENVTIKDLEQSAYYKSLPATIQDLYVEVNWLPFDRQSLRMLDELDRLVLELRAFD